MLQENVSTFVSPLVDEMARVRRSWPVACAVVAFSLTVAAAILQSQTSFLGQSSQLPSQPTLLAPRSTEVDCSIRSLLLLFVGKLRVRTLDPFFVMLLAPPMLGRRPVGGAYIGTAMGFLVVVQLAESRAGWRMLCPFMDGGGPLRMDPFRATASCDCDIR